ncbi:MAG: four helix bundle protein [Phycisphaerales bacterium]|nr:four helix bundle protein [Phycisphaerales bacterium]
MQEAAKNPDYGRDLRTRTKQFALRIVRLCAALPDTMVARTLGRQVLRSGTSVGANYREAQRARSRAEFASKAQIVLQELDETAYWLELISDGEIVPADRRDDLRRETEGLISIMVASVRTSKSRTKSKT